MRNNKGQALIEFVLIMPVIILLFFSIFDLGRIILENNKLENATSMIVEEYKNDNIDDLESFLARYGYKNIDVDIDKGNQFTTITLTKDVDLYTPGINKIISNPYKVKVERTINDE